MLREDIEAVDKIELFSLVPLGPTALAWGRIKKELSELAQLSHNTGSPKLLDELESSLVEIHHTDADYPKYLRCLEIVKQLRAGARARWAK